MAGEEKKKDLSDLVLERGGGCLAVFPNQELLGIVVIRTLLDR